MGKKCICCFMTILLLCSLLNCSFAVGVFPFSMDEFAAKYNESIETVVYVLTDDATSAIKAKAALSVSGKDGFFCNSDQSVTFELYSGNLGESMTVITDISDNTIWKNIPMFVVWYALSEFDNTFKNDMSLSWINSDWQQNDRYDNKHFSMTYDWVVGDKATLCIYPKDIITQMTPYIGNSTYASAKFKSVDDINSNRSTFIAAIALDAAFNGYAVDLSKNAQFAITHESQDFAECLFTIQGTGETIFISYGIDKGTFLYSTADASMDAVVKAREEAYTDLSYESIDCTEASELVQTLYGSN